MRCHTICRLSFAASSILAIGFYVLIRLHFADINSASEINRPLMSVSYNPSSAAFSDFSRTDEPDPAVIDEIDRDLANISKFARSVRTYSVAGPLAAVPRLALRHGLDVNLGIQVTSTPEVTRREMERGIALANRWPNVKAIYVGNETLVRKTSSAHQLQVLMQEVRRRTGKPVTTGETWDNWINNPSLAENADFIGAHILPYWEGVPANKVLKVTFDHYDGLRQSFPRKPIMISEFGWPSRGMNHLDAVPGLQRQAMIMRNFVAEAQKRHIYYNLVEAEDQPWKINEGGVGTNWGILYANGLPKFNWSGPLPFDPDWILKLIFGLIIGSVTYLAVTFVYKQTMFQAIIAGPSSLLFGFGMAQVFAGIFNTYMSPLHLLSVVIFIPISGLLIITISDRMREGFQHFIGGSPSRLLPQLNEGRCAEEHFVSVHVPICNEKYEVVADTLMGLARVEWSNFEVLVVLNNYKEQALRSRIFQLCQTLGPRFKFVDLPKVSGFKAGALNKALNHTSDRADIIAVVDADYVVDPSWLKHTLPAFNAPHVALVQAPQDHRQGEGHWSHAGMNVEYGAFFDVGMVQRNEHDAIIAHGTMLLLRRTALERVGGWDEHNITEDTELGLRLLLDGWSSTYTTRRLGAGLLPDDLLAYRRQRFRWAYGAMTILRKHWRDIFMSDRLTTGQRYHFIVGWIHWIGDGLSLVVSILSVAWAAVILVFGVGLPPPAAVSIAIMLASGFSFIHGLIIHMSRQGVSAKQSLLGTLLAMALQMPIGRGVLLAAFRRDYPFIVTAKGGAVPTRTRRFITELWPDALMSLFQLISAAYLVLSNQYRATEIDLFALVMLVQSIPYCVTVCIGLSQLQHARRLHRVRAEESAVLTAFQKTSRRLRHTPWIGVRDSSRRAA